MFGIFGYSASVAAALYEIGITGVPPHRIDQNTKTVICGASKKIHAFAVIWMDYNEKL